MPKVSRKRKVNPSTARLMKAMGVDMPVGRTPKPKAKTPVKSKPKRAGKNYRVEDALKRSLGKKR